MAHYLIVNEDGTTRQESKGRGRTKAGFIESEPGVWTLDPTYVAPTGPKHREPKVDRFYKLIKRDEQGNIVEVKDCQRGRPPIGFVREEVDAEGNVVEQVAPEADQAEERETVVIDASEAGDIAELGLTVENEVPTVEGVEDGDSSSPFEFGRVFKCKEPVSLDELLPCIKHLRKQQDGDIIKLMCCDIVGHTEQLGLPYLIFSQVLSHIRIDMATGNIYIWSLKYNPRIADVKIEGAIRVEVATV
jgi:hypothetical protein